MKVLVACEFSGTVRDAFTKLGHDATSCDLLPCETPGKHYQGDVRDLLDNPGEWDLMVAFPPCTYLCSSGLHWNKRVKGRERETHYAMMFVFFLIDAPVERIAIENPIGCISSEYRKPDQIIQPYQFGHPESKSTCLWLKNLPLLKPTNEADFKYYRCKCGNTFPVEYGKYGCCETAAKPMWDNQTKGGQNKLPPSKDRWKLRSKTYQGIADAMAKQWSNLSPIIKTELF